MKPDGGQINNKKDGLKSALTGFLANFTVKTISKKVRNVPYVPTF